MRNAGDTKIRVNNTDYTRSKAESILDRERRLSDQLAEILNNPSFRNIPTLAPILPALLNLKGKPYTLKEHFPFEPLFSTRRPRKLVVRASRQTSKSTSISADGVVTSVSRPYFNTLFVTPLFEMVRRLSTNYVASFIKDSPFQQLFDDAQVTNNVLQRTFANGSTMFFSYCFRDADRVRGINSDKLSIDESVLRGTTVATVRGQRAIETLQPNDMIYAIDEFGHKCLDKVVSCSDHGIRSCFEIELSNGDKIAATSETYLATTVGWKKISSIITDYANASTGADVTGNDVGRRVTVDKDQKSEIQQQPRLLSARIQCGEVPGITRVRRHASQEEEELRFRKMVERLGDIDRSSITPYSVFVSSERKEKSNSEVVRQTYVGRDSLVVSRRRWPSPQHSEIQYAGIHERRGGTPGFLADAERYSGPRGSGTEKGNRDAQKTSRILDSEFKRRVHISLRRKDKRIRSSNNAIQMRGTRKTSNSYLSLVSAGIRRKSAAAIQYVQDEILLSGRAVSEATNTGIKQQLSRKTGSARKKSTKSCWVLCTNVFGTKRKTSSKIKNLAQQKSRENQSNQAKTTAEKTTGQTRVAMGLRTLRPNRTARRQGRQFEVLPFLSQKCGEKKTHTGSNTKSCETAEIVRITYIGEHSVFDIETEKHHTFFAGGVAVHNCQDFFPEHLPVVRECMSGSPWAYEQYTGTPKTMENLLEQLWLESSMAEWVIKCEACNHYNIPSLAHDLDAMIGPNNVPREISEQYPGIVCAKCSRPVNPRIGRWIHAHPELRSSFVGYHVPQIIMPMHYANEEKWALLLAKRQGFSNTSTATFYNEVCGEGYDQGSKLVSLTELKAASSLHVNTIQEAVKNIDDYIDRVIAVDWGGGGMAPNGKDLTSYTSVAVCGLLPNGKIDVIFGWRSKTPHDHNLEAKTILQLLQIFKVDRVISDYGGAGAIRETLMHNAGLPLSSLWPVAYIGPTRGQLMRYIQENQVSGKRGHFQVDKSRALILTCEMIRYGLVRFFAWDKTHGQELQRDFLALVENKSIARGGPELTMVIHDPKIGPDDFAHAVNIGICSLCFRRGSWPDLARAAALELSEAEELRLNPANPVFD
jgi:hypothetical protein